MKKIILQKIIENPLKKVTLSDGRILESSEKRDNLDGSYTLDVLKITNLDKSVHIFKNLTKFPDGKCKAETLYIIIPGKVIKVFQSWEQNTDGSQNVKSIKFLNLDSPKKTDQEIITPIIPRDYFFRLFEKQM